LADVFPPTLGRRHPMAVVRRWIMPDMLLMSAIKFGYPIQIIVQPKSNNFSGLAFQLSLRLHDQLFAHTYYFTTLQPRARE
jgi:hypothetical protein